MMRSIKYFLKLEGASGLILLAMALLAMLAANTPLSPYYETLQSPSVMLAINDGLMALFFLVVGIEIKHELAEGSLSPVSQAVLPFIAALGGIIVPAVIYSLLNWDEDSLRGAAIPTATDIAFSLGVLALFGSRIPASLRIFLMSVAVFDDLIAVAIIAFLYTSHVYMWSLALAAVCIVLLALYNRYHVSAMRSYLFAGCALWVALLDSGVNATIAGVILGLLIPLPLGKKLLRWLRPWVAYGIVPLFAFANAGIPLAGLSFEDISHPVTTGIAGGLILGKPLGIFAAAWLFIRLGYSRLPPQVTWPQLFAVSIIAGIGFTMCLFIGSLAFGSDTTMPYARLGIIIGSLVSAVAGMIAMAIAIPNRKASL